MTLKGRTGILSSSRVAASFVPTDLTNCSAWFDAADAGTITDAGAGAVSQWDDKSGNARHVSQATAANRPVTGTNTINGRNVITFNGTSHFLARDTTLVFNSSDGTWSAAAVVKKASNSGTDIIAVNGRIVDGSPVAPQFLRTSGTTTQTVAGNPSAFTVDSGGTVGTSTGHLVTAVCGAVGTSIEIWLDLVSGGSTALPGSPAMDLTTTNRALILGQLGGVSHFDGQMAEVVIYSRALTSGERGDLETYLRAKWATP